MHIRYIIIVILHIYLRKKNIKIINYNNKSKLMKHLIETTDSSSLGFAEYDRLILDSTKNEIIYRGGVNTNGHSYVDLGLPSGTLWATMNVGATTETDYGDYFMWGETTPNTVYDWATYKHCNGSDTTMTKYCTDSSYGTVDNKTTLDLEDDAARANMGGDWRMPTATEYQTLYNETLWVWCPGGNVGIKKTDESGNESIEYIKYPTGYFVFKTESDKNKIGTFDKDEKGNLTAYTATSHTVYYPGAHEVKEGNITSIADGDTHIFFPASGYAEGTGVYSRGSDGSYWSGSLHPSYSHGGLCLLFDSGDISPQNNDDRFYGSCVRGVCE